MLKKMQFLLSVLVYLVILPVSSAQAQETTFQRVRRTHSLTFVADRLNLPYACERDSLPGIDVELARHMARELNLRLYYRWVDSSHEPLLEFIANGQADLALGIAHDPRQVGRTWNRFDVSIVYTSPFYSTGYFPVLRTGTTPPAGYDDWGTRLVGVEQGSLIERTLKDKQARVRPYANQLAVLLGLRKREVDAGMLWADADYLIHENPGLGVLLTTNLGPEPGTQVDIAGVVLQEDGRFLEMLNRAVQQLVKRGIVPQILRKYHMPYYPPAGNRE